MRRGTRPSDEPVELYAQSISLRANFNGRRKNSCAWHPEFARRGLGETVASDRNRVTVHRLVISFRAMSGPEPSAKAAADPRTVRLALELLERTAGRRRRCRRCRSVIAENARKRGQAWSVCTPCAQAIEDEARQIEIAPARIRRCIVCRADIVHLRADARTCDDACRNVLSRLLRRHRRPVL